MLENQHRRKNYYGTARTSTGDIDDTVDRTETQRHQEKIANMKRAHAWSNMTQVNGRWYPETLPANEYTFWDLHVRNRNRRK